jgi:acetolactate synthase-1/2/3 large subunit
VERLLGDIREVLPRDGIFLTDVGIRHQVAQQFDVYDPRDHYVASGWGTMGGAVAAALGAKLGAPDRAVVAEVGDGAFTSILSAVVTAVEHDIPVVWIVMNNFGYSSISVYQHKHGLGALGTAFRTPDGKPYNPDFAALAQACGALGATVTDPADLRPALQKALDSGRPYVLDVHTEKAPRTRATGKWDVNDILSGSRNA